MAACTPTPTQTLYSVQTTTTISTSFSEIVTTIPPDLSTILSTLCESSTVDVNGTTSCLSSQTTEIITTIQGEEVTTISAPVEVQVTITLSEPTKTLFATCPTSTSVGVTKPPSSPTSPPPPLIVTQVSSTLANGSVVVTLVTYTSTSPPTWAIVPTSATGNQREQPHSNNGIKGALGPIIGGILGGFLGLFLIVLLIWFIWRRRDSLRTLYARQSQYSTNESTSLYPSWKRQSKASSPQPALEPKPYQYGLVGRKVSTPSHSSSPSTSPAPTRPQSLAFTGLPASPYSPGFSTAPSTPNVLHTTSPILSARPVTPQSPLVPPQPSVQDPTGSTVSVGTAVSYPYPVLPPEHRDSQETVNDDTSVTDRRAMRLSLTLANWNPETDGELLPRASEDSRGSESVRQQRGPS